MSGPYGAWCTLKSVGPLMHPQETLCLTTFISIVLKNHKIGRPNGHAVLPSNLLTLTFSLPVTIIMLVIVRGRVTS